MEVSSRKIIVAFCFTQWTSVNIVYTENKIRSIGSWVPDLTLGVLGPEFHYSILEFGSQVFGS